MSAFIDTNVLIRHLTGDRPRLAAQAAAFLRDESELFLADLIVAETVDVWSRSTRHPGQSAAHGVPCQRHNPALSFAYKQSRAFLLEVPWGTSTSPGWRKPLRA